MANVPGTAFGTIPDCQGATLPMIRGVEVPGLVFWHGSGPSRRNRQVDTWRLSFENGSLARFRIFKRLFPKGAPPS
eukprot:9269947-Pyramimonas_sp.AAC.1